MKLAWVAAVAATLLFGAANAQPALDGEDFIVGFSDDMPRAIGEEAVTPARDLGAGAFRFTLQWEPGQTRVADSDIVDFQDAVTAGLKVVLAVYNNSGSKAPKTGVARDQYCAYVKDALARLPSMRDVVIWNEPNKSFFWSPQLAGEDAPAAPVAYEAVLARCYDVLHEAFTDVNVIGLALSPTGSDNAGSHSPGAFIRAVGDAYRASGRARPLLDTVGHHVYGFTASERPWRKHIGSKILSQGDWNKLMYNLWLAFSGTAQAIPTAGGVGIWYMEGGSQTAIDDAKRDAYTGTETVAVIPDYAGRRVRGAAAGRDEPCPRPVHTGVRQHPTGRLPALRRGLLQLPALRRAAACRLAVGRLLGRPNTEGFAARLRGGDHGGERRHGRLRRAQGRGPERGLHAALDADRPRRDRAGGATPRRGHVEREQRRPELDQLSRLPKRRPRGDVRRDGVDEQRRRARDDVHIHRPRARLRRESGRRVGGHDRHNARAATSTSATSATTTAGSATTTAGSATTTAGSATTTAGSAATAAATAAGFAAAAGTAATAAATAAGFAAAAGTAAVAAACTAATPA